MKQSYFLGSTSPSGFSTDFEKIIRKPGYYTYILKGGPGTGKSTLMKKIASGNTDSNCELYYCSSDIRSLDAVVLNDRKIIITDGTAPHTFDPFIPGVSQEIINLGRFWNRDKLRKHSEAVSYCFSENALYHQRASRCVKALSSLVQDICTAGYSSLNTEKLEAYSERIISGFSDCIKNDKQIKPEYRQLSAFTSHGYITRELDENYSVYVLKDDMFAASDFLLRKLNERFCSSGYITYISKSAAFDEIKYEHLLIPELKTAFMSSGFFSEYQNTNGTEISLKRFYDKKILSEKKNYISFSKKAANEIKQAVTDTIDTALNIHDELEKYYISSLETDSLNEFTENFIRTLNNKSFT